MKTRVTIRKRLVSGNLKDPELHQQRIYDIQQRREILRVLALVAAGAVAFMTAALVMWLRS